jgi:phosphoserine phosphatase
MHHILCIIAAKNSKIEDSYIESVSKWLEQQHYPISKRQWLSPNRAADLWIEGVVTNDLIPSLKQRWPFPADIALIPQRNRQKNMLISDMDSTLINQECIDELADFVGKKVEISHITEQAMRGELDFTNALRQRVAMLKGLPVDKLAACLHERITLMDGAKTLVATMRHYGAWCVLVSGGFTFFTAAIASQLGFQYHEANELIIEQNQLTGTVKEPILDKYAKEQSLKRHCQQQGFEYDDVIAVGDGANDLPMLLSSGMGVAYHAKPIVAAQAPYKIEHNDLSALLFLQGYAQNQWHCN